MCQLYFKNKDHRRWRCPSRLNVVYSNHVSCIRERLQTQPRTPFDVATSMPSDTSVDAWKKKNYGLTFPTFHMGSALCTCAAPRGSSKSPNGILRTLFDLSCLVSRRCCCPAERARLRLRPSSFTLLLVKKCPVQSPKHLSRAAFQQAAAAPGPLAFLIVFKQERCIFRPPAAFFYITFLTPMR